MITAEPFDIVNEVSKHFDDFGQTAAELLQNWTEKDTNEYATMTIGYIGLTHRTINVSSRV